MAYSVILSLNTCYNELMDVASCEKGTWETKWYNNELSKNLIDQLVI